MFLFFSIFFAKIDIYILVADPFVSRSCLPQSAWHGCCIATADTARCAVPILVHSRAKIFWARAHVYVCHIYIILYINPESGSFEEGLFSHHFRIETKKFHKKSIKTTDIQVEKRSRDAQIMKQHWSLKKLWRINKRTTARIWHN
jgi:hypothetical protein